MDKRSYVCIFAHPDDEAFVAGGTIAKYASRGDDVYLICVTDGDDKTNGEKENLPKIRQKELKKSAEILGIKKVFNLGYKDGELRNNIYHEVAEKIEKILTELKPDTLITFEPRGVSGHIDHMFCSMITSYLFRKLTFIKRVLYAATTKKVSREMKDYFIFFPPGYDKSEVDKVEEVGKYWDKKIKAIMAHESQIENPDELLERLEKSSKEELFLVKKRAN